MNIAELRNRLADIAAELAEQDVQQVAEGSADSLLEKMGMDPKYFPGVQIEQGNRPNTFDISTPRGERVGTVHEMGQESYFIELANGDDYLLDEEDDAETTLQSMYQKLNGDSDMEESVEEFAEEDMLEFDDEDEEEAEKDSKKVQKTGSHAKRIATEDDVEETVEVPVAALAELMQLAGYANYADKLAEYENEPEEEYMDIEDQLIGLAGGLNGPKKMYAPAADGDNPMDQEPRKVEEEDTIESVEQSLYKSYKDFLEAQEIEASEEEEQTDEGLSLVTSKDGRIFGGAGKKGSVSKGWLKDRDSRYDDAPLRQVRKDMK